MSLGVQWVNAGGLTVSNATLNLGGTFTVDAIGAIHQTGGAVNLTGTLNSTMTRPRSFRMARKRRSRGLPPAWRSSHVTPEAGAKCEAHCAVVPENRH